MKDYLIGWVIISIIVSVICSALSMSNDPELFLCGTTIVIGVIIGFVYSGCVFDEHQAQRKRNY